jgi:hypothetical protein
VQVAGSGLCIADSGVGSGTSVPGGSGGSMSRGPMSGMGGTMKGSAGEALKGDIFRRPMSGAVDSSKADTKVAKGTQQGMKRRGRNLKGAHL